MSDTDNKLDDDDDDGLAPRCGRPNARERAFDRFVSSSFRGKNTHYYNYYFVKGDVAASSHHPWPIL